jgi:hypothetical protein
VVFNFSLIQRGYQGEEGARIVMKESQASRDFLGKNGLDMQPEQFYLTTGNIEHRGQGRERDRRFEQKCQNYDPGARFDFDDLPFLPFCMEICLDHRLRRVKNAADFRQSRPPEVQLIPSARMNIREGAIAVPNGGIVFQVDGSRNGTNLQVPGRCFNWFRHASEPVERPAELADVEKYFKAGPGSLDIFGPQPLRRRS